MPKLKTCKSNFSEYIFANIILFDVKYYICAISELRRIGGTESYFYYYYDETGICGFNCDGVDYLFQKNFLGDVLAIYNKSGDLQCKYVYDAWGNHRIYDANGNEVPDDGESIGSKNPIRYRGYYWDREFCMYYLKSRYYCPELGRYISPDNIAYLEVDKLLGFNLYAYCYDNPIAYIDPDGHAPWWKWLFGIITVIFVSALTSVFAAGIAAAVGANVASVAMGAFVGGTMRGYNNLKNNYRLITTIWIM